MTVEIPAEFQQFVHNAVDRGSYKTEAEVVGNALAILQERERQCEVLRRAIQPALERLDRGEGIDLDDAGLDALCEEIKAGHGVPPQLAQDSQGVSFDSIAMRRPISC